MTNSESTSGSIVHVELTSEDVAASRAFVEDAIGWEIEAVGEGEYTMLRPPTPPYGGVMAATQAMPVGTLLSLLVEDAAAATGAVGEAGGRVLREPFDVEGWGTMAVFEAPGGVVLAAWANAPAGRESPAEDERPGREIAG